MNCTRCTVSYFYVQFIMLSLNPWSNSFRLILQNVVFSSSCLITYMYICMDKLLCLYHIILFPMSFNEHYLHHSVWLQLTEYKLITLVQHFLNDHTHIHGQTLLIYTLKIHLPQFLYSYSSFYFCITNYGQVLMNYKHKTKPWYYQSHFSGKNGTRQLKWLTKSLHVLHGSMRHP